MFVVVFLFIFRKLASFPIGFRCEDISPRGIFAGLGAGLVFPFFSYLCYLALSEVVYLSGFGERNNYKLHIANLHSVGFFQLSISVLIIWFWTALSEEVVFRGYFLQGFLRLFEKGGGGRGAYLVLSSFLFAVPHINVWGYLSVIPIFAGGMLFGFLYISCRENIFVPIIAHAVNNTFLLFVNFDSAGS